MYHANVLQHNHYSAANSDAEFTAMARMRLARKQFSIGRFPDLG
jgi:hypothetical protein